MATPQIPREKIPWLPSMNYDLCKGAKECLGRDGQPHSKGPGSWLPVCHC